MNFIIDRTMPDVMVNNLEKIGNVYKSAVINAVDEGIASHPDLQIHFLTQTMAICGKSVFDYYRSILPHNIELYAGKTDIGDTYPQICAYNIARVGEFVICNLKYAEKSIIDFYKRQGKKIINVKQGYTKCNICPISDNTFITEDMGIHNAVQNICGINSVILNTGSVALKGFDYGFIGGATGFVENKVLFCGSLSENPYKEEILLSINKCGAEYFELSNDKLYDYGSIISFG